MKIVHKSALAAMAALISISAHAQPFGRGELSQIDTRQARQEQRIERGMARGEITRHEGRRLIQEQREIARVKARAAADGRITRTEMRELTAMLDQADVQIRQVRHDRDGGYPR